MTTRAQVVDVPPRDSPARDDGVPYRLVVATSDPLEALDGRLLPLGKWEILDVDGIEPSSPIHGHGR